MDVIRWQKESWPWKTSYQERQLWFYRGCSKNMHVVNWTADGFILANTDKARGWQPLVCWWKHTARWRCQSVHHLYWLAGEDPKDCQFGGCEGGRRQGIRLALLESAVFLPKAVLLLLLTRRLMQISLITIRISNRDDRRFIFPSPFPFIFSWIFYWFYMNYY